MAHKRSSQSTSKQRDRRGVSTTSFALVAPIFFLFVFGMIEVGRLVMVQHAVTHAARVGCRTAILATTTGDADVEAAVLNQLRSGLIGDADVSTDVAPDLAGIQPGTEIAVNVSMDFADVSWLPAGFVSAVVGFEAVQNRE